MTKLLGNLQEGRVIVISAPSGTGKTTLVHRLIAEFPNYVTQSISCTTRPPRKGEIDGKDYVFLTEKAFEKRKVAGEFLEHATVFNFQYGTLKEVVKKRCANGSYVILVLDTQGALELQKKIKALFVFITPPSMDVLTRRLAQRNSESEIVMKARLDWAQFELDQAKYYDYQIVNDDLEITYQVLRSIVIAEEHKITR